MIFDPLKLVRKNIRDLKPYSSARDEFSGNGSVFLDANESPFNSPYNRYPDPYQKELKAGIAELFEKGPEQIFLGNGSDEAIDLLFRVFCEPGKDNILSIAPSYGMYKVCADINNIEYRKVLLNEDFSLNAEALLKAADPHSKLLFLCSPNNPSGNLLGYNDVVQVLKGFEGLVILDEAYIDFSGSHGFLPELEDYPNLVILRTFSKAWAMAAIRLGMAFASPEIIRLLTNVKYPYNLNYLTQSFALEKITEIRAKEKNVNKIIQQRRFVTDKLKNMSIVEKLYPSDANFILAQFHQARNLYNYLIKKGVIVRDRSNVELCEGCLRLTIGTGQENKLLLEMLQKWALIKS